MCFIFLTNYKWLLIIYNLCVLIDLNNHGFNRTVIVNTNDFSLWCVCLKGQDEPETHQQIFRDAYACDGQQNESDQRHTSKVQYLF